MVAPWFEVRDGDGRCQKIETILVTQQSHSLDLTYILQAISLHCSIFYEIRSSPPDFL